MSLTWQFRGDQKLASEASGVSGAGQNKQYIIEISSDLTIHRVTPRESIDGGARLVQG